MNFENVIVVTGKTRLEQLIERFNTKAQARFYIEHSGGDFKEYENEHDVYQRSLDNVLRISGDKTRMKWIDRKFLPNFIFGEQDVVVALGQDGLVANTAKYINGQPLLGVNPDAFRNDGILLPFSPETLESGLRRVLQNKFTCKQVTMAQATTNDGQALLAFNDLFIGPSSHTSARYSIAFKDKKENQSSSGVIVSTGAGSTGWLSSVLNMSNGIVEAFQQTKSNVKMKMDWSDNRLVFVVREPFLSKHSQVSLAAGIIADQQSITIESHMPFNGVIFSDGIEADFLKFNSGCQVKISVAGKKANMVQGKD